MFEGWDSYYLLIGSAGGALIGLLFVVVTLTTGRERTTALLGARVYMTPTLFHFAVVLVISALATAPHVPPAVAGPAIGALAVLGLVYVAAVALMIGRRKVSEAPHWSDFWCYGAAPGALYLVLLADAVATGTAPSAAAPAVAITLLALLLVGIRNAWDLITWLAPGASQEAPPEAPPEA